MVEAMKNGTPVYWSAVGSALVTTFVLIWMSLGVGIIGADGDPANRMYFGVVAVGLVGALVARLRARGMTRTLLAMALAQAVVAAVAILGQLGLPWSGPLELLLLNGFFIAMFVGAAALFRRAAGHQS
jgi:hypothetical protein